MSKEQTSNPLERYMKVMADNQAADMYFVTGAPPNMKCNGKTIPVSKNPFKPGQIKSLAYGLLSEEQVSEFEAEQELNLSFGLPKIGRFRVNIFVQRTEISMVIRYIKEAIPDLEDLGLPTILKKFIMEKTGLVLVVGSTGSGKSTTLASMINYRNRRESGHILTIEDPIEFVFKHDRSIISQREVGIDTKSYDNALREAMREAPEVIMIGEARSDQLCRYRALVPDHAACSELQPGHGSYNEYVPHGYAGTPADGLIFKPESSDITTPAPR